VDDDLILDYYRLDTGIHEYQVILPSQYYPSGMEAAPNGNTIWFLAFDPQIQSDVLFVWDLECSRAKDSVCYLQDRWSPQNLDLAGLEQCAAFAADLSSKYGIQILIGEDTVTFSPDHYSFLPEHQVPVILKQLEELDHALSLYPQDFLSQLAPSDQSVTICLVRKISGSTDSNGLESPVGLQFWDSATTPYIAIASGADTAQNIHHEIFHIIDSRVLSTCNAYDHWDDLNPTDFSYDYDYVTNLRRDDWVWVIGEDPYFIDLYAMSFPKEDRARIMEYAMTEGHASVLSTPALQAKLYQICSGIREAFLLEGSAAPLPWEQYLSTSLVPTP
jgi:hypothetical protein